MNHIKVTKVSVLHTAATDKIILTLDAETAFPEMKYPSSATVEARSGYGVEWAKLHFPDLAVEVIDC